MDAPAADTLLKFAIVIELIAVVGSNLSVPDFAATAAVVGFVVALFGLGIEFDVAAEV